MTSYRVTIVYYVQRDYLEGKEVSSRKIRTAVNFYNNNKNTVNLEIPKPKKS